MAKIQVLKIKKVNSGNLKAFVDVEIDGLKLYDFRVVQQPGQVAWVSVPQKTWVDDTGKTRYSPTMTPTNELKKQIDDVILAEYGRDIFTR